VPASWRELARTAAYDRAYETLGKAGIARAAAGASVDVLLDLADVARLSGHPEEALAPLTTVADQHAGDARAPLAAYTLGSVLLSRAPALAAARFEQAIGGGLPVSLVEDALAHVVEARARAGDHAGAQAAAARYERAYPQGRQREVVRRWAGTPGDR
jgi:transmembrane sensor